MNDLTKNDKKMSVPISLLLVVKVIRACLLKLIVVQLVYEDNLLVGLIIRFKNNTDFSPSIFSQLFIAKCEISPEKWPF